MNCYLHAERDAAAYCRNCGRALCSECERVAQGTVYCQEHAPLAQPAAAPTQPVSHPGGVSPGLAFVLGLIPGVGAIYNGQYVKGLIHVIVLGTLISIMDSGVTNAFEPLFGLLIALWFFYMAFEAYHTASKRQRGEPVDEFSSLIPMRSPQASSAAAPVALIILGALFLVMNLRPEWTRELFRFWPALLIAAGVYMLVARWKGSQEVPHERQ